jgi:hypothetical protein
VESATAYLNYMRAASQITPDFADGESVARQVKVGAAYQAKQFEEGAIAYAAIIALQEPSYVQGVRAALTADPAAASSLALGLIANPMSAMTFAGASAAASHASAALRIQGDKLLAAGRRVKQAAYDVQHSAWSKGDVADPEVRLAGAKTLSSTVVSTPRDEANRLLKLVLSEQGASAVPSAGVLSPVVARGMALAALAVIGEAGQDKVERISTLLAEPKDGECLKMAKLNLFQCLAVAGPHYEDIFCLGQHAMMDTATCVIKASGATQPVTTAMVDATAAAPAKVSPAPDDYWVPVAGSKDDPGR